MVLCYTCVAWQIRLPSGSLPIRLGFPVISGTRKYENHASCWFDMRNKLDHLCTWLRTPPDSVLQRLLQRHVILCQDVTWRKQWGNFHLKVHLEITHAFKFEPRKSNSFSYVNSVVLKDQYCICCYCLLQVWQELGKVWINSDIYNISRTANRWYQQWKASRSDSQEPKTSCTSWCLIQLGHTCTQASAWPANNTQVSQMFGRRMGKQNGGSSSLTRLGTGTCAKGPQFESRVEL